MNRKALGALASTFILIAFSIILGLIFMSWGKNYIEQRAEFVVGVAGGKAGCADIRIGFIDVGGEPQVCTREGKLQLFVENTGNTDITQMQARLVDSAGVRTLDDVLRAPLNIGQSFEVPLDMSGTGKQVKLTPQIIVDGKAQYCFDKALSADGPFSAC